ncbi:MAG: hypothetical protein RI897_4147 [Verrucomicrobiota bacterium]|jgi:adenosylhomocysteine nucleosidase
MPAQGPILITFAVRNEANPFVKQLPHSPDVLILITGIGPDLAAKHTTALLHQHRPRLIISSGFTGALNPDLQHGDLLHDASQAPQLEPLLTQLHSRPSRFLQSPTILTTPDQKQTAFQSSNADAVEMESHAIREIAKQHHLPCAILRVVSDIASESLPPNMHRWLTPQGSPRPLQLALQCLQNPATIPMLIRLGKNSQAASKKLAATLSQLLQLLPSPGNQPSQA